MLDTRFNSRVKFPKGKQKEFLEKVIRILDIKQCDLAKISNVCSRTLADWKKEKYNIGSTALRAICKKANINFPKNVKILPENWSLKKACRLGGRRYVELYGSPGTRESRIKGGLRVQEKLRLEPHFIEKTLVGIRKKVKLPENSIALAEFIGIMLGDGGISSDYQISISFNWKKDLEYAHYIQRLVRSLFSISSTIQIREKYGSANVVASSRNLVEFLNLHGIKKGNKITHGANVPQWIFNVREYKIACLRGLMDTDGGLFYHKYISNKKEYVYLKMCFTSYSPPLLNSVTNTLRDCGFRPKNTAKNRVYLYDLDQINRYFRIIGSSNPRYLNIYKDFISQYRP